LKSNKLRLLKDREIKMLSIAKVKTKTRAKKLRKETAAENLHTSPTPST